MTNVIDSILLGKRVVFLHIGGNSPKQNTVIVDFEDIGPILSDAWHVDTSGYARCGVRPRSTGRVKYFHREIMGCGPTKKIDHRNGDTLDDRKINLRECTHIQNMMNTQVSKNNKSGFKGVSFDKPRNKWCSAIWSGYKKIHIGRFSTPEEAAIAYNAKAKELFGEFARLNHISNQ